MRISTSQLHSQGFNAITKHQNDLLETQIQLSTGKRVNKPGDDPVANTQIHSLKSSMNTIDQYASNGTIAKTQLVIEETAVTDIIGAVQRARDLALQMSNDTYNKGDRQSTAAEIGQLIEHVRSMMNYANSEGEKLFAGNNVSVSEAFEKDTSHSNALTANLAAQTPPIVNNGNEYFAYIGSENATNTDPIANFGARFVQIGFDADSKLAAGDVGDSSRVRITDNGSRVFDIPNGTTVFTGTITPAPAPPALATPDSNILNVLVEFKIQLEQGLAPTDSIIDDMDISLDQMSLVRAEIGGRQNRIEAQYNAGENFKISMEERRMNLEDMDIVEGISKFTQSENALKMAQQVFAKVQQLSLFDYIR